MDLVQGSKLTTERTFLQRWQQMHQTSDAYFADMVFHLAYVLTEKRYRLWGYESRESFRAKLNMPRREFDEFHRFGRLLVIQLGLTHDELRQLGKYRARLICTAVNRLLTSHGREPARLFVRHVQCAEVSALENRFGLQSLVSDAVEGRLHPQAAADKADSAAERELQAVHDKLLRQILQIKDRFPDPPPDFIVSDANWRQLAFAVDTSQNVLLIGPAGSGKTELVGRLAGAMDRPLKRFSFGAMSDPRTSLIGTTHYTPATGTVFEPSRFAKAIQVPKTIALLDELNRTDRDTFNLLMPLLDGQRYLALDEAKQSPVVHVADQVCFIATMNVGSQYTATANLDAAIRDRFSMVLRVDYPSQALEKDLLLNRHRGVNERHAQTLVEIAAQQRRLASEGDFEFGISTRMLLATAMQLRYRIALPEAIEYTLTNHFSDEGGLVSDQTRFRQLIQRYLTP